MKRIIETSLAPKPIGPYSQAVMANGFLFTSGQIAIDPSTNEYFERDVEFETHLVMKSLQAILDEAGLDFTRVIKTSIFLKDMNEFAKVNAVYSSYFTGNYPARETVQVSVLPKNARVEISMVAC
jgi:2-iminobutanoate/2-iminopropanoate deaminase